MRGQPRQAQREQAAGGGLGNHREQDLERGIERFKQRKQWDAYLARWDMNEKQFRKTVLKGIAATADVNDEYQEVRSAEQALYQRVRYTTTSERERELKLPHDYQYSDAKPHEVVSADTMFGYNIDLDNVTDSTIDSYAEWLTHRDNPTFTRVIANRLWIDWTRAQKAVPVVGERWAARTKRKRKERGWD